MLELEEVMKESGQHHVSKKAKSLMSIGLASMMALNLTACNFGQDEEKKDKPEKETEKKDKKTSKKDKKKNNKKESKKEVTLKDGGKAVVGTTNTGQTYMVLPNTNISVPVNNGNTGNSGNTGNTGTQTPAANKGTLKALVDSARLLDWADFTDDSFNAFQGVLTNAMNVLNNANATQAQVDQAVTDLQNAIGGLVNYVRPDTSGLESVIQSAKDLNVQMGDYSNDSYNKFTQALQTAQGILNSAKPTDQQVADATQALQDAMNGLTVDYAGLQGKFDEAKALDESKYTPESYEAFKTVLEETEKFLSTTDHKQSEVDKALATLEDAMKALVEKADKTQLTETLNNAEGYLEGDYTEKTLKALQDAVDEGKAILADENASVTEVSNAVRAINDAIANLLEVVHKEEAQALYDKVKDTKEDHYTLDSYNVFKEALDNLKAVLGKTEEEGLTKEELANAQNALQEAYDNLVEYVAPNTDALEGAIAQAKTVQEGDYSAQTYNALQTAIKKAEETLGIHKVSQAQVDEALANLNSAYEALTADESALSQSIATAKGYAEADYTPTTWNALQEVIKEAEGLLGTGAKQSVINDMQTKVDTAVAQLVKRADTTALAEALSKATTALDGNYTQSSKSALQTAVDQANQVVNNPDATQAQVDSALKAVNDAMEDLVEIGDKETLQKVYDELSALDEDDYTPASWAQAGLGNALETAKAVLDKAEPSVEEVSNALDALKDAQSVLVKKADFTQLTKAIAEAEKEVGKDYTKESLDALNSALATAKEVSKNENATKQEVDSATTALQNAIDSLQVNLTELVSKLNDVQTYYNTYVNRLTTNSKTTLESAISNAKNLISQGNVSFEDRDNAIESLTNAKENAKLKADTSALEATIAQAKALSESTYTEETWSVLESALADAEAIVSREESDQSKVDKANQALAKAIASLEKKPFDANDYLWNVLMALVDEVDAYNNDPNVSWDDQSYRTELRNVRNDVYKFCSKASFNPDQYTQEEYEAQYNKLLNAFNEAKAHSSRESIDEYKSEFISLCDQIRTMLTTGNYDTISKFKLQSVLDDYDAMMACKEVKTYKNAISKAKFAIANARPMTAEDSQFKVDVNASKECFEYMNKMRVEKGLEPLNWDDELFKLAEYRVREFYQQYKDKAQTGSTSEWNEIFHQISHTRPGTVSNESTIGMSTIFEDANYKYFTPGGYNSQAENAAGYSGSKGQSGYDWYMQWYNSPGHRANMMTNRCDTAVTIVVQTPDGRWVAYQLFTTGPNNGNQAATPDQMLPTNVNYDEALEAMGKKSSDASSRSKRDVSTYSVEVDGATVEELVVPNEEESTQGNDTTTTEEGTSDTSEEVEVAPVDYSQLSVIANTARSLDRTLYTSDSLATLDTVLAEADTVLASMTATQDEVNNLITRIQDATNALVEVPVVEEPEPMQTLEGTTEEFESITTAVNDGAVQQTEYVPRHAISE